MISFGRLRFFGFSAFFAAFAAALAFS